MRDESDLPITAHDRMDAMSYDEDSAVQEARLDGVLNLTIRVLVHTRCGLVYEQNLKQGPSYSREIKFSHGE